MQIPTSTNILKTKNKPRLMCLVYRKLVITMFDDQIQHFNLVLLLVTSLTWNMWELYISLRPSFMIALSVKNNLQLKAVNLLNSNTRKWSDIFKQLVFTCWMCLTILWLALQGLPILSEKSCIIDIWRNSKHASIYSCSN